LKLSSLHDACNMEHDDRSQSSYSSMIQMLGLMTTRTKDS